MGCRSPFGSALACEAKANLHPLAFYTINVTSPQTQARARYGVCRAQLCFLSHLGAAGNALAIVWKTFHLHVTVPKREENIISRRLQIPAFLRAAWGDIMLGQSLRSRSIVAV